MREWRNRQTRTFKVRVGDHTGSSPVSRTIKQRASTEVGALLFYTKKEGT